MKQDRFLRWSTSTRCRSWRCRRNWSFPSRTPCARRRPPPSIRWRSCWRKARRAACSTCSPWTRSRWRVRKPFSAPWRTCSTPDLCRRPPSSTLKCRPRASPSPTTRGNCSSGTNYSFYYFFFLFKHIHWYKLTFIVELNHWIIDFIFRWSMYSFNYEFNVIT